MNGPWRSKLRKAGGERFRKYLNGSAAGAPGPRSRAISARPRSMARGESTRSVTSAKLRPSPLNPPCRRSGSPNLAAGHRELRASSGRQRMERRPSMPRGADRGCRLLPSCDRKTAPAARILSTGNQPPCVRSITVVMCRMAISRSKLTSQGQISVPAEVRKKLGVGPGSALEWDEENNQVVVRRAGRYSSAEVHEALFPEEGARKSPGDGKEGIRKYIRKRHARH